MKIVLFYSCYQAYINRLYSGDAKLAGLSYADQLDRILSDYFGWPPALVKRLEELGCQVEILVVNLKPLQQAWAKENNFKFDDKSWQYDIPKRQVEIFQPDIIWIVTMFQYYGEYLTSLRRYCKKIFAWIASPVPSNLDLSGVDCLLTSHKNFQDFFMKQGKDCEIILPAFESKILDSLTSLNKDIECSFIGSLSYMHLQRMEVIKELANSTPIQIWSDLPKLISKGLLNPKFIQNYLKLGKVRARVHPSVWGIAMYTMLARSKMTVNIHVDAAAGLAGNIRMFEATGVGTLLIAEDSPNMAKLYRPGVELVTYKNIPDLIEIINYYIEHPKEREMIAKAGQQRTMTTHSTQQRSQELLSIFKQYL
jgi:spore maturation protein CgeB